MDGFLNTLRGNVRQRTIAWEGAVRAGTISEAQLQKIQSVGRVHQAGQKRTLVESDLEGFRLFFVGDPGAPSVFESARRRSDVVQYVLVLLADLLEIVPSLAKTLHSGSNPYTSFLPFISRASRNSEDPISLLTASVLAKLMQGAEDESPATLEALPILLAYLADLVKSDDHTYQEIAAKHYSVLLYSRATRRKFWDMRSETISPLFDILTTAGSPEPTVSGMTPIRDSGLETDVGLQLLYYILLVFWQLSFDAAAIGDDMEEHYDMVATFTSTLRLVSKPKTTRLLVATLLNMIKHNRETLLPVALMAKLPALLENVAKKKQQLNDEELQQDLAELTELLEDFARDITTFDQYVAEVRSGHLRWTPPHKNDEFWQENARHIAEFNQGELLKKLAEIMSKPWDQDRQVLAVACNDVGYLVREVPDKRRQMERIGMKARTMELMVDDNDSIRWHSLRTIADWLKHQL